MRTYEHDSPQAAARVVAMAALADGNICHAEAQRLEGQGLVHSLGLPPGEWLPIVRDYCEDLQAAAASGLAPLAIDAQVVDAVLDDVRDPELQRKVCRICATVVDTDAHVAHGETLLLRSLESRWPHAMR